MTNIMAISGIPSSIIWMRLAYNYGNVNMIILAMLVQVIGILIPTFTNNVILNILSAGIVLFGAILLSIAKRIKIIKIEGD